MVKIGVNLNNRAPLLTHEFTVEDMFDLAEETETLGYDWVCVGDNLLQRPRLEPLTSLAVAATRTETIGLGTACMITPLRNPIQFAQAWATLDQISGGRMALGACMGQPGKLSRKQYEAVGVPFERRARVLEEGIEVMKALWRDGTVNYSGKYFEFEDVSFDTGNELIPFRPDQDDPPVWIASNPSQHGRDPVVEPAIRRIVDIGDGWLTCCRAAHPDEYEEQWNAIVSYAEDVGRDPDEIDTTYQFTTHIADSQEEADQKMMDYMGSYDVSTKQLDEQGPRGSAENIIEWIETFNERGCENFILRFAAYDQLTQARRFAEEVLPAFE